MRIPLLLLCSLACTPTAPPAQEGAASTSPTQPAVQEITIGARGNLMAYDRGELRVRAGGSLRITFVNPAEATMAHNIVFVQAGQTQIVAEQCTDEGSLRPDAEALKKVLGQSETIQPGKRTVFAFETPPPGRYEYVCTVRGHSQTMRGWLIVDP